MSDMSERETLPMFANLSMGHAPCSRPRGDGSATEVMADADSKM